MRWPHQHLLSSTTQLQLAAHRESLLLSSICYIHFQSTCWHSKRGRNAKKGIQNNDIAQKRTCSVAILLQCLVTYTIVERSKKRVSLLFRKIVVVVVRGEDELHMQCDCSRLILGVRLPAFIHVLCTLAPTKYSKAILAMSSLQTIIHVLYKMVLYN